MHNLPLTKRVILSKSDLTFATGRLCEEPAPYGTELLHVKLSMLKVSCFFRLATELHSQRKIKDDLEASS